jgi:Ca2+-binding RTX toxin-like protein
MTITTISNNAATTVIDASANTGGVTIGANGSTTASTITGGSGNDSFVGSTKADVITLNAGDDTVNAGAGADSINGGDGNDTFIVSTVTDFTLAVETVVGGADNDTLSFTQAATATTLTAANLSAISGIETISINATSAAASVTLTDAVFTANGQTLSIVDGDLTTSGGTLTVDGSALTAANAVAVTANTATGINDTLTGGAGNDSFTFATTAGLESTDTVVGGAGTDTIKLTATAAVTAALHGVRTVENITTTGAGGNISITVGSDNVITASTTLTTNASSSTTTGNTLTYDGSAVSTATKVQNVTGTAGADTITGGAGNDIVVGGDSADKITGGAGVDNLSGGAGDDLFVVGTAAHFTSLATVETVSGGTGTDVLEFSAGTAATVTAADLAAISSIEKIRTLDTTGNFTVTLTDAIYTANGNTAMTINASALTTGDLTVTASSLTAANSVTVEIDKAATDSNAGSNIALGAGNDTVKIDLSKLDDAATISGGSGNDTLTVTADTGNAQVTLINTVTGFETMNFGSDDGYSIVTVDANVASGVTLTVDGSALITTNTLTFNGSAELDGKFAMTGGAASDTLTGGSGVDTISGGAGADVITGGAGADSLTGAAGADVFVYTSASVAHSAGTNADTITDFATTSDKIQVTLDYSALSAGVDVNAGFVTAVANLSAKRGEMVYDSTASKLYINVNNDNLITTQDFTINTATVAAGDVNAVVTGSGFGDTIVGGSGADTITGGAGIDVLTGGLGADSFVLNGVVLAANRDSITDFVSGTDKLVLGIAQTTVATAAAGTAITGTSTTAAAAGGGAYTLAGNNTAGTPATITTGNVDIIKIANIAAASANNGDLSTAGVLDGTELLKAMTDTTATDTYNGIVSTIGDTGYIQATQGGVTYLYYYAETGNTSLTAAEIILVGTFSNGAVLVAGDITLV